LQKLRDEGRDGMAAGAGFRDWENDDLEATKARVANYLKKLETILPR
jgi:3-hydroxybutyryl-CoA dehydrogenase